MELKEAWEQAQELARRPAVGRPIAGDPAVVPAGTGLEHEQGDPRRGGPGQAGPWAAQSKHPPSTGAQLRASWQ